MLSMLVCVSAVAVNASVKFPTLTLSKALSGKLVRPVQPYHAKLKLVPADVSIRGKLVRPVQPYHALAKSVPEDVSIRGNDSKAEQSIHALAKLVPEDVSIRGKLVRLVQFRQA